jgi:hypothetical protein
MANQAKSSIGTVPMKELEEIIELEDHSVSFLHALAKNIQNGKAKYNCELFSQTDESHEEELKKVAVDIGLPKKSIDDLLSAHKIDPDAYSIAGILEEVLTIEKEKIKKYHYCINYSRGAYRIFFKKYLSDSIKENKFLIKELAFRKDNLNMESKRLLSMVNSFYLSL